VNIPADKEVGDITDLYDNINVFVPPEVKEEIHTLYKELEYKYTENTGRDRQTLGFLYCSLSYGPP